MAKAKLPNQKKAYQALDKRLVSYISQVQGIYESVAERAASLAISTDYNGSEPFSFASYSDITQAVKNLQASFVQDVQNVIYAGTSNEWKQSNQLQDLLVQKAMTYYRAQVNGVRKKQYYQTNSDVLKAFQTRTENGMNLSSKLWNQSEFMLREMEASIGAAIQKGMSATTLSKRIFKYLNDFPSLKRDFYEKYAKAADIYDCEYRTIRLARSEINIAYRLAEQTRWQQLDFILGYEIKLSGSHPVTDICDLLKGKYPKDFKWNGWHPNCFCYAVPIIMSDDEYESYNESGKKPERNYDTDLLINYVGDRRKDLESQLQRYVAPYWYKENKQFIERAEKERKYVMTDKDSKLLVKSGFESLSADEYNKSAIKGFNLVRFNSVIDDVAKQYGINITDRDIQFTEYGNVELSFSGRNEEGEPFAIMRRFYNGFNGIEVEHSFFDLPSEIQGKGISKRIFKELFTQYEKMGVSKVTVHANIDVGPYCWARYGFAAESKIEIESIVRSSYRTGKITESQYQQAMSILDCYKEQSGFPVRKLAELDFGRDLLIGEGKEWFGYIDMHDIKSVKYTKRYIGL